MSVSWLFIIIIIVSCFKLIQYSIVTKKLVWKGFYNRETFVALPSMQLKPISPFLNTMISVNHDKMDGFSAYGENIRKGIVFLL